MAWTWHGHRPRRAAERRRRRGDRAALRRGRGQLPARGAGRRRPGGCSAPAGSPRCASCRPARRSTWARTTTRSPRCWTGCARCAPKDLHRLVPVRRGRPAQRRRLVRRRCTRRPGRRTCRIGSARPRPRRCCWCRRIDTAAIPLADRAGGVWNMLSGAVQALVVRDLLDTATACTGLLAPGWLTDRRSARRWLGVRGPRPGTPMIDVILWCVDDSVVVRRLIVDALDRRPGHRGGRHGRERPARPGEDRPAASRTSVTMDIEMPQMNGIAGGPGAAQAAPAAAGDHVQHAVRRRCRGDAGGARRRRHRLRDQAVQRRLDRRVDRGRTRAAGPQDPGAGRWRRPAGPPVRPVAGHGATGAPAAGYRPPGPAQPPPAARPARRRAATRHRLRRAASASPPARRPPPERGGPPGTARSTVTCAIGSSTGGPDALTKVLMALPADLPVPIVVTQHMPPVFTRMFAERLDRSTAADAWSRPATAWNCAPARSTSPRATSTWCCTGGAPRRSSSSAARRRRTPAGRRWT